MSTDGRTITDYLTLLFPTLHVPADSGPSCVAGFLLVTASIYTTTITNPKYQRTLAWIRRGLSVPAVYFFLDYGWLRHYSGVANRVTYVGLGTVGCVGIMKVLDICWIRELDDDRPRWVKKKPLKVKRDAETETEEVEYLPIPTTFLGRLGYSFDLFTTFRGNSWFSDRVWDFAHPSARAYVGPSRLKFLANNLVTIGTFYLLCDVFDTFVRSMDWNTSSRHPVTGYLSPLLQVVTALSVCANTVVYLAVPYAVNSSIFVMLGSSPSVWPPVIDAPFQAMSLGDFWSRRWHAYLRRIFGRISMAMLWPFTVTDPKAKRLLRQISFFIITTLLHIFLNSAIPPRKNAPPALAWAGTVKFFAVQPVGLFLESTIIIPWTERFSPRVRTALRRAFAWSLLLWVGRWWADDWVGNGLYDETERPLAWSPVRGLLYGKWVV